MKEVSRKMIVIMVMLALIITGISVPSIKSDAATVGVKYRTHVQNDGNQDYVSDGKTSGTSGRSLRLEGIWIELTGDYSGGISYKTHVQDVGWQSSVSNGAMSGTTGKSKRLEGISISLTGNVANSYDIYYRVHCQDYGWLGWAKNGELSGSEGISKRLEGIQIILVAKGGSAPGNINSVTSVYDDAYVSGVIYRTHVQNDGWQNYVGNAKMSGTSGKSYRLEGINVKLTSDIDGGITYRTHVQNDGWQSWKSNGTMAGTSGRSLRLEAIEIKLTGNAANNYDVYYRTHVQDVGWQGWVKNGTTAGTSGRSLRLEAIEIKLVKKTSSTNVAVTGVSISGNSSVNVGSTITLTGAVTPTNATDKTLTWSSSSTSVATVSSAGVVTGKAAGTTTITATATNGVKATKSITVNATTVAVTGVSISGNGSVNVGSTITLSGAVTPTNATDKTLTWSSSSTSVATVSSAGVVTGKAAGTTTITATATNGVKATKSITVNATTVAVTGVSISGNSSVNVGNTITLTGAITPTNATDKTLTWSSSNTSVATVSSAGVVTGKAVGTVTITATATNGVKATKSITVSCNHNYVETSNTATCDAGGTSTKKCSICGDITSSFASPIGHKWVQKTESDGSVTEYCTNDGCSVCYSGIRTYQINTSSGTVSVQGIFFDEAADLILQKLNTYRSTSGVSSLTMDSEMKGYAQTRAIESAYSYSHTRPDGTSFSTVIPSSSSKLAYAENLTYGQVGALQTSESMADNFMDAWKNSSGHNRNMIDSFPKYVGVSIFSIRTSEGTYTLPTAVQIFAR